TAQVQDGRITYLKLTPAHLGPLLDHAAGKGLLFPDLRLLSVTTAPVTAEQRGLARERLCANTVELFGTNETGVLMRASPVDQDAYPGALGRAVDGVEAGIVDADDAPVPTGEIGQLRFRGPGFVTNYLNAPEAAIAAFQDGWFYPGDLASMNGEGTVFYKGRADDMINNAGVKFYPIEVEAVLLSHPDITEAAVFGWPFPPHGEAAVACLVANRALSERELRRFCAKLIANHKIPHRFLVVPELPKNQMGKIQKTRLKELYGPRLPKPAP
ncbi:MAG: long-chain fatty acid--CoA ligase, partial [Rhodospirillaceae bacterium]|nr:long-chain fatty acid--CoA ligase [Rhodospirillaceae bacterium]